MKQIWQSGAKDYFNSLWNVIDSAMLSLLLAAFVLELVVPLRINQVIREPLAPGSGGNVTSGYSARAATVQYMCSVMAYEATSHLAYCQKGNGRTTYGEHRQIKALD